MTHAQEFLRRGAATVRAEGLDASEDYRGCFSGDALIGNGAEKRFVRGLVVVDAQLEFDGFFDERGEARIVLGDVGDCFAMVEGVCGLFSHLISCEEYRLPPGSSNFSPSEQIPDSTDGGVLVSTAYANRNYWAAAGGEDE